MFKATPDHCDQILTALIRKIKSLMRTSDDPPGAMAFFKGQSVRSNTRGASICTDRQAEKEISAQIFDVIA